MTTMTSSNKHRRVRRGGAKLGQHFLKHAWAARALAYAGTVAPGVIVLEVGPGKGTLTQELLALGGTVIAVEKDPALIDILKKKFAAYVERQALTIVEADIRDITPKKLGLKEYVLAANIPYYITGEIIRTFLTAKQQPRTMALLVQKEVAQRIATSTKESVLSLSVKAYGTPKLIEKVSRKSFSPAPSVDSAILAITNISKDFFKDVNEERFFKIVRAGFSSKRKLLSSNLKAVGLTKSHMNVCGISEHARAEDVPLEKWHLLAKEIVC